MDPITDVFKTMHVASVVHARLEATAPWGLTREGEAGEQQAPHSAGPGYSPSQFAHFGMVSRGNCWLSVERIPAPFPPDIAVEVLSPCESAMDVRRKVRDYLRGGSKEGWLLDHLNGEALVHTSGGIRILQGNDLLESPVLPGFSVSVADVMSV